MAHSGDSGPLRGQATEAVSDELKSPKGNCFTEGEGTTRQTFIVNGDGKRR
jgi:hypothetical protein